MTYGPGYYGQKARDPFALLPRGSYLNDGVLLMLPFVMLIDLPVFYCLHDYQD